MNEEKEVWYQSKAVWGSLIIMIIGIVQSLNIDSVGSVDVQNVVAEKETIIELLTKIGIFAGGLMALWGRLTARKKVVLKK